MTEKLDIIIFGATGFTGKYTVYEAVEVLKNFRWGVAGRSKSKLEAVLKDMGMKANTDLTNIPIIEADVENEKSLSEMASKCRVLVNCCGPYRFFGEPVVKACIEAGTHHVDVSGEPQYMETMQMKYNELAKKNKVYVISACGFDSIPAELGIVFVEKNFDGTVNSVETYLQTKSNENLRTGAAVNYGTWESAVYGLAHANELRGIRSKLYKERLPKFQPVLQSRPIIHKSDIVNGYCLPFPGSDRSVVMRSQRYMYENEKKRPIQMLAYVAFGSWIAALMVGLLGMVFGLMTKFALGRQMLLKHPKLFSLGFFSRDGPTESYMESTRFKMTFYAKGWPEKLSETTDEFTNPPTKTLMARVTGVNPGYGATCITLLTSAVIILKESEKMPADGGVLPPGAAFAKTSMITELEKYEKGLKFEILAAK